MEIEGYVVELGADGRLVELQLEELTGGVRADRRLVCKDYFIESSEWVLEQVTNRLAELSDEELLDLRHVASLLRLPAEMDLDSSLQPRGYRLLSKIPRLPEAIAENVVAAVRATAEDHAGIDLRPRRGRRRRRGPRSRDQGRALARRGDIDPRPVRLTPYP